MRYWKDSLGIQDSSSSLDLLVNIFLKSICLNFRIIQNYTALVQHMDLRKCMEDYFSRPEINAVILEYAQLHHLDYESLSEEQLMHMLEDLQLLGPILQQIAQEQDPIPQVSKDSPSDAIGGNSLFSAAFSKEQGESAIQMTVEGGRKFREFIGLAKEETFRINVCGFGQKCRTKAISPSESFTINEKLSFKAPHTELGNTQNLQLSVTRDEGDGTEQILGIKLIEWRYCLCFGRMNFDVELAPYCPEGVNEMQALGILSLRLQLSPINKLRMSSERGVNAQIELQKRSREQGNDKFYRSANDFYNDYKALHRSFVHRRVKIYADSEDRLLIPLPKLITPLYNVRGIESPSHALRFVSLIPLEDSKVSKQFHKRFNHIIIRRCASLEDHCNLLCSLLLGLGLKAYVCLGLSIQGEHAWVITEQGSTMLFWECTKGLKFDYYSPKTMGFYRAVHVIYTHNEYYANIQSDDSIAGVKFTLSDPTLWKQIDTNLLTCLTSYSNQLALSAPTLDSYAVEQYIEGAVLKLVCETRKKSKLPFQHDRILSSILSTALCNYETEIITGTTFCEEQFQAAIKNYIPQKHTFKAFPIQSNTINAKELFETLLRLEHCREIIMVKGEEVHFAVKSKLVIFPDNFFALWISLAARYFQVRGKP